MNVVKETTVKLTIPFSSSEIATLVKDVLTVDKELKGSGVAREITSNKESVLINFNGSNPKKLRVAVNSIIKNIVLIVKTVKQFEN